MPWPMNMPKGTYHLRRKEKAIDDLAEIQEILAKEMFMTIAMCRDNEPYLVSLNYSYDSAGNVLYFHCSREGKKNDFLAGNDHVYGQILDDRGYVQGECDYDYRSVHFQGNAEEVSDAVEKKRALEMMIDKLESDSGRLRGRLLDSDSLSQVGVFRIDVKEFVGKKRVK